MSGPQRNSVSQPKSKSTPPVASASPSVAAPPAFDVKTLGLRVGLPIVAIWLVALLVRHWIALSVAGILTAAAAGLLLWLYFFTQKAQRVRQIVGSAQTKEERQEAIDRIDREFKKGDSAAIFAKAQLLMQEDPRAALATLEEIDLNKVMANIADEARGQRAMLHLLLGEPQQARPLADAIDFGRHTDRKAKASLAAVVCEAWARTGQGKRAKELLALYDANDAELKELRPGLLRAQVFVSSAFNDLKTAKGAMHQLAKTDPRIVAGFAQKGMHPLVVKEAQRILQRAGMLPKMMVRSNAR